MGIISGYIRSTKVQWLPVLSNIVPREKLADMQQRWNYYKFKTRQNSWFQRHKQPPNKRFKSRYRVWSAESTLDKSEDVWKTVWRGGNVVNGSLVDGSNQRVPGFELPRALRNSLNRIRTEQRKCDFLLHKKCTLLCEGGYIPNHQTHCSGMIPNKIWRRNKRAPQRRQCGTRVATRWTHVLSFLLLL